MKVRIDVEKFLNNIESYAKDTKFDYTYYLVKSELKRMRITERIGELRPEHMNPVLLLLRDWMPSGWVTWSEKSGRRWQMDSELCQALNKLSNEFRTLRELDLARFEPDNYGDAIRRVFEQINALKLGVSEEAIATVTSKVMHLLNSMLFVMWDTSIIDMYGCKPNVEGHLEFLGKMKELAKLLEPQLSKVKRKTGELRKSAEEVYGIEICSEKSLAKLIDEHNWIESKRRRRRY